MTSKTKVHFIMLPILAGLMALLVINPAWFLAVFMISLFGILFALMYFTIHETIVERMDSKKRRIEYEQQRKELNDRWDELAAYYAQRYCMSEPLFSLDLMYDLHKIVGIDAVNEAYEALESEADKEEFLRVLKEYYDTKYWTRIEGGCAI